MARNNRVRERVTRLKGEFEILRSLLDDGVKYIEVPREVLKSDEVKSGLLGLSEKTGMKMDDPDHQKLILSTVFHHLYGQRAGGRPSNIDLTKFELLSKAMRRVESPKVDTVAEIVRFLIAEDPEIKGWSDSKKDGLRKRLERIMDDVEARKWKGFTNAEQTVAQNWLPKISQLRMDKRVRKSR